jgi:PEP-CTERM motif
LTGDYNHNGIVDAADYTIWRDTFGQTVAAGTGADGDGDGIIGQNDYAVWTTNFGRTAPGAGSGAAAAVPEPTAGGLLLIGAVVAALGRRRK